MWLVGTPSAGGKPPEWQLAHCAVTRACVWFQLLGLKLATLWQLLQLAEPVGMWPLSLPLLALPLWQLAQSVAAVKVLWSGLAPAQLPGVWQFSQLVTPLWMGVLGLPSVPTKLPVWQVAHCVVTLKLAWNRPSAQLVKLPLWQLSQDADAEADTEPTGG
jgi:hypothetical protein